VAQRRNMKCLGLAKSKGALVLKKQCRIAQRSGQSGTAISGI
jgi:hypothetical protein